MAKKKSLDQITKHHIVPQSRGGQTNAHNIATVNRRDHNYYHALFYNRTPEEIVEYLNENFWNGNYEVSIKQWEL